MSDIDTFACLVDGLNMTALVIDTVLSVEDSHGHASSFKTWSYFFGSQSWSYGESAAEASPQHQHNQQDVDHTESCRQQSWSGVHVKLQFNARHRDTRLTDKREARLQC